MTSRARVNAGVLCISSAFGMWIVFGLLAYAIGAFLPSTVSPGQESFYFALHTVWLPLIGAVQVGASASLLAVGNLLVWNRTDTVGPGERPLLGLARLSFVVALVAAVLRFFAGLALGFLNVPDLRTGLLLANVAIAVGLGLSLYWLLLGLRVRPARLAGIVALVAGSLSSVLANLTGDVLRGAQGDGLDALAVASGFLSLVLWLALYLWEYEELRLRGSPWAVPVSS